MPIRLEQSREPPPAHAPCRVAIRKNLLPFDGRVRRRQ
jgi:hypothetical protein